MSRRWIWWMLALLVVLVVMAAALWQATAKCLVPVGQLFSRNIRVNLVGRRASIRCHGVASGE